MAEDTTPVAEFDLDAWINGTTGVTGTARIVQRGDLLAEMDNLERRIEIAKGVPASERGADDDSPDTLRAQWEQVAEQVVASSIIAYIQDRTEGRRQGIRDRLKKDKVTDADTIGLHVLADAIVKVASPDGLAREFPDGFPPEKLRAIRDRGGDSVLVAAWATFSRVTSQEPDVSSPTSRRSYSRTNGRM